MHIIKRRGHKQEFDEKKLYASVYAACLSLRMTEEQAELISNIVTHEVQQMFITQEEVSSRQLLKASSEVLHRLNPEAAFMYESHRDVS